MSFEQQQKEIDESLAQPSKGERLLHSIGPLAAGYLVDALDLFTFGPIGFYLGPMLGGLLGWWLAKVYRLGALGQSIMTLLTAVYCMFPATEFVPLATIILALIRFAKKT